MGCREAYEVPSAVAEDRNREIERERERQKERERERERWREMERPVRICCTAEIGATFQGQGS